MDLLALDSVGSNALVNPNPGLGTAPAGGVTFQSLIDAALTVDPDQDADVDSVSDPTMGFGQDLAQFLAQGLLQSTLLSALISPATDASTASSDLMLGFSNNALLADLSGVLAGTAPLPFGATGAAAPAVASVALPPAQATAGAQTPAPGLSALERAASAAGTSASAPDLTGAQPMLPADLNQESALQTALRMGFGVTSQAPPTLSAQALGLAAIPGASSIPAQENLQSREGNRHGVFAFLQPQAQEAMRAYGPIPSSTGLDLTA